MYGARCDQGLWENGGGGRTHMEGYEGRAVDDGKLFRARTIRTGW